MAQRDRAVTEVVGGVPGRQGVYYGWYVVVTAMFIAAVTTGARNGFGVFVLPDE